MTMDNARSKRSMAPRIVVAVLLLWIVPLTQSAAQEAGGTIVGTVTDATGAVVADAAVTTFVDVELPPALHLGNHHGVQ